MTVLGILYWADLLRKRAANGSAVTVSYPDACFIASALENANRRIEELEDEMNAYAEAMN